MPAQTFYFCDSRYCYKFMFGECFIYPPEGKPFSIGMNATIYMHVI